MLFSKARKWDENFYATDLIIAFKKRIIRSEPVVRQNKFTPVPSQLRGRWWPLQMLLQPMMPHDFEREVFASKL